MDKKLNPIGRKSRPYSEEKTEKSTIIPFRVPASWKPAIQQDAERLGMGLSEYIRSAIIDKYNKTNTKK